MKKWIFEMLGAVVAILLFLYVITVFQSCKTPKPVAETISNTEVRNDSVTNTTTETEVKETIKESDVAQSVDEIRGYCTEHFTWGSFSHEEAIKDLCDRINKLYTPITWECYPAISRASILQQVLHASAL